MRQKKHALGDEDKRNQASASHNKLDSSTWLIVDLFCWGGGKGRTRAFGEGLSLASELVDFATVALGWSALRRWAEDHSSLTLLSQLGPQFAAGFGFAVQRLGYGSGAAHLAKKKDFHFEITAFGPDLQEIANVDFACRLGRLMVGLNPAEIAGSCSQAPRFEKSRGPQPFVHANAGHDLPNNKGGRVCCAQAASGLTSLPQPGLRGADVWDVFAEGGG